MDCQSEIGAENLNILYGAALEFGENWRRPIIEWVRELLPELDDLKQTGVSRYVEKVRDEVEEYVRVRYDEAMPERTSREKIHAWIRENYPWMAESNVNQAYSQAMYYAWHG